VDGNQKYGGDTKKSHGKATSFFWFWMILDDFRWFWMILDDFRWFWMILDDFRWSQHIWRAHMPGFHRLKHGNSTKVTLVKHDLETKNLGIDTADTIKITKTTRNWTAAFKSRFVEIGGCQPIENKKDWTGLTCLTS
jgi:hypothetical protein